MISTAVRQSVQLPKPPRNVCISPTVSGHVCTGAWPSQVRRRRPNQSTPHMSPPYLQNTISTQTDQKASFLKAIFNVSVLQGQTSVCSVFWINAGLVWPKIYITVFFKIIPVSQYMTVFIFFMHNWVLTTFSTDRERKNCSRLTYNAIL